MAKFFDQHKKVILPVAGAVLLLLYLAISGNFSLGWNGSDVMNGGNKKTYDQYPQNIIKSENDYEARIYVNGKGTIVVDLFEEDTPLAVNNFVFLSNEGFYNNMPVFYIENNTLLQSGDPIGDGSGNPGYRFQDEIKEELLIGPYSIVYANENNRNTNGSQYFIVCKNVSDAKLKSWQGNFTVFGVVTSGKEVIDGICELDSSKLTKEELPNIDTVTIRVKRKD